MCKNLKEHFKDLCCTNINTPKICLQKDQKEYFYCVYQNKSNARIYIICLFKVKFTLH